jgi:hypothetical protein
MKELLYQIRQTHIFTELEGIVRLSLRWHKLYQATDGASKVDQLPVNNHKVTNNAFLDFRLQKITQIQEFCEVENLFSLISPRQFHLGPDCSSVMFRSHRWLSNT